MEPRLWPRGLQLDPCYTAMTSGRASMRSMVGQQNVPMFFHVSRGAVPGKLEGDQAILSSSHIILSWHHIIVHMTKKKKKTRTKNCGNISVGLFPESAIEGMSREVRTCSRRKVTWSTLSGITGDSAHHRHIGCPDVSRSGGSEAKWPRTSSSAGYS